ncbi:MAG: flagellar basal body P-ring formation protein FlgA [Desulfobacter sp.]|nr:MAG: flagellar basal body P-ring formation protein FlgA [Desulfobacter sp.]
MTHRDHITAVIFLAVAVFFSNVGTALPKAAPQGIFFHEYNTVDGEDIRLADIAEIKAPAFIAEMIASLSLGRAPKPGRMVALERSRLLSRLRNKVPGDLSLNCPDRIYVKRSAQELDEDRVAEKVGELLAVYFNGRAFKIKQLRLPGTGRYPSGDVQLTVTAPVEVDAKGGFRLAMDVGVDGNRVDNIRIRGHVSLFEPVACAARDIRRGEAVSQADVILVERDIFTLRGAVVRDAAQLNGKMLRSAVRKNTPIQTRLLEKRPVIKKGEVVALTARADHLKIVTSGIAREDGFRNEPIRVENLGSGKVVRGIVREGTTVEVIY